MGYILYNISQVIGVTILHSLWQGLIVYILLRLVLMILPGLSASVKYNLAIIALTSVTIWFIYTLFGEINVRNWIEIKNTRQTILPFILGMPGKSQPGAVYSARYYYTIQGLLPYITLLYMAGLIFNTGKLIWARQKLNTLRKSLIPDIDLQFKVTTFVNQLNISEKIQLGLSTMIDVPCVIGYFKPFILLPFTLSTYLSAEEIEIIILHELAHIKRNDYLANLAQQTMSILVFFNPFAHLMERIINKERENSCDAIVVRSTQKPLVYAHALLKLEQKREHEWQLTVAATSKKYHLLNRIEQIMKPKKTIVNARHILLTIILFTVSVISVAWLNPTIANGKISIRNVKPEIKKAIATMTAITGATPAQDAAQKKLPDTDQNKIAKPIKVDADDNNNDGPNAYQLFGFGDPKFDELNTEYRKHRKIVEDYQHSDEYKLLEGKAHGYNHPLVTTYDNDTLTAVMTAFKQSANILKSYTEGDIFEKRAALGKTVGAYYSSDDFKKLNQGLQKKYNIEPDKKYDSNDPDYKKYLAAVTKKTPADIKDQIGQIKQLSRQIHEIFNSPAFKANIKQFNLMRDSLQAYYKKPHVSKGADTTKQQFSAEETSKYREQFEAYRNNPDIKREQQLQIAYSKKMADYMATPEFSQHVQAWKNELRTSLGDNTYDKIFHPDHVSK